MPTSSGELSRCALHCLSQMPSKLMRPRNLLLQSLRNSLRLVFCPACSYWRSAGSRIAGQDALQTAPAPLRSRSRTFSTVASTTAINATKTLPPTFKELHEALSELNTKAANYVNLSRLQLALRGLETTDTVIRVAGETIAQTSTTSI